jgi:tetratricopeptide (TPR) repeat protein
MAAATKMLQEIPNIQAGIIQANGKSSMLWTIADVHGKYGAAAIALQKDDLAPARRDAWDAVLEIQAGKAAAGFEQTQADTVINLAAHVAGQADYRLGDYANAEKAERIAVDARRRVTDQAVSDRRDINIKATWLAMAIARQGRTAEAAKVIAPVIKFDREIEARNHGDQWLPVEFAGALYAEALTDKARAPALLREAVALIDSAVPAVRAVHDVRKWRERIAAGVTNR